ncbi:MAG TPA: TetR/AcrR family transcriptional regulator [Lachnospiraceae bacterium]|nr:TetR/AcrR family transcriptional regulator [Lachnospiraceae bacterium]
MPKGDTREPKQQRSIEKKRKIIEAGFKSFCEKGYHKTNTAEIAKLAGVSTGIVYSYFKDKREIFILGLNIYCNNIADSIINKFTNLSIPYNIATLLSSVIEDAIEFHKETESAHQEIESMVLQDADAYAIFQQVETKITHAIAEIIEVLMPDIKNVHEKIHIAYDMIENLCHETIYYPHECIDYQRMKEIVINAIIYLLQS